ncbi:MAG TPA: hypothetical protein VFS20_31940 [Longimicrobium sp.]|nr:hypothetical protein [Longimicrobium sp.]
MYLPDRGEPADGIVPGLIGPVNPPLPSIRDSDPPMPARTQKFVPSRTQKVVPVASPDLPASDPDVFWLRMVLYIALCIWDPELWVFALLLLGIVTIPGTTLEPLLPKHLIPKQLRPKSLRQQPTLIQTNSGDTWITHVPSVVPEGAPSTIRLPFRVMSGLLALLCMLMGMVPEVDASLSMRITSFLGGVVFGAVALVPDGDLRRLLPRISTAPRLPAPGDDAGAG